MKKQQIVLTPMNPGIMMVVTFVLISIVNMAVIHFASLWFPTQVVLGTMSLSYLWALGLSSKSLALILTFAMPFVNEAEKTIKRPWSMPELMGIYFVINFVGLWMITRFAEALGLGVTSWMVVLALAVVLDLVQGFVMMQVEKMRTNN